MSQHKSAIAETTTRGVWHTGVHVRHDFHDSSHDCHDSSILAQSCRAATMPFIA